MSWQPFFPTSRPLGQSSPLPYHEMPESADGALGYREAAAAGLACYEIAAELAAEECGGPGTFNACLFDRIHRLTAGAVTARQKVSA